MLLSFLCNGTLSQVSSTLVVAVSDLRLRDGYDLTAIYADFACLGSCSVRNPSS